MSVPYCASSRQIFMLRLVFIQLKGFLVCSKFYLNADLLSSMRLDCASVCFSQESAQNAVSQIFSASLPLPLLPPSVSSDPATSFLTCVFNCFSQSQTISRTLFLNRKFKKGIKTDPLMQTEQKFPICSLFMIQFSGLGQR